MTPTVLFYSSTEPACIGVIQHGLLEQERFIVGTLEQTHGVATGHLAVFQTLTIKLSWIRTIRTACGRTRTTELFKRTTHTLVNQETVLYRRQPQFSMQVRAYLEWHARKTMQFKNGSRSR